MCSESIYSLWQQALLTSCLVGLAAIGFVAAFRQFAPLWDELWGRWLRLDGFGKAVVVCAIVGVTLYGGSKNLAWQRVPNDGADAGIGLVGVFTQPSNDVQTVGGVTTTNALQLLAVMWTTGTVTPSTPVSYRQSNTNDWSTLVPLSYTTYTDGTTNILQYVLSEKLSYPYWWVGEDKPAVIVTSSEIKITAYRETSTYVRIEWTCDQPLATTFDIKCKKLTDANWTTVTTTSNQYIQLSGFYVDKNLEWKITSTYLEDGE